jgi:predicted MFS family arabinose efflux permease
VHRLRRGAVQLTADSPGSPARLVRDRATWALYALFAAWGWFLYSFNPSVPLIGADLGVSAGVAGLHGTALAVGTVLAGLLQAPMVARRGRRGVIVLGAGTVVVALVLITTSGVLVGTLGGAVLAGVGGSAIVNAANVALDDKHGRAGGAAITEANGLGALVGALAPVVLGTVVAAGLGWQPALLVVVVLLAGAVLALPPLPGPGAPAHDDPDGTRLPPRYWWAWAVLVTLIGVEFSFTVWGSTLVAERTGVPVGTATSALTVLVLGLAAGRVLGSRLALRFGAGLLLLGAIAVASLGWLLVWTSSSLTQAVVGLAVSGLGMALHFPLGVSRALEAAAGKPDLASGRISLGVGLAVGAAPFALGALTDAVGVQQAFLLVPGLLALAGTLLLVGRLSGARRGSTAPPLPPTPAG